MKTGAQPSPLELQVLSVLWAEGPATVREVLEKLPDGRVRAYTTALSVLQTMERKGFVSRKTSSKAHVYKANKTEKQILSPLVKELVNNVFGGNCGKLIETALDVARLTESEKNAAAAALKDHKPKADPK